MFNNLDALKKITPPEKEKRSFDICFVRSPAPRKLEEASCIILSAILDPARHKVSFFSASSDSASRWVVPPLGPPPYEPGFSPTIQAAPRIPNLNRLNQHPHHPFVDNSWSLCNNMSARWLSQLALYWWYLLLIERTITSSDLLACGNWFRAGRFRFTAFYCGTINVSVRRANGCSGTTHEGYNV